MGTKNNVISLKHSVERNVEDAIIDALSNRGGNWVARHVVENAAERVSIPNLNIMEVIDKMVRTGLLEKSLTKGDDKFNRTYHLPLYRLCPRW